MGRPRWHDVLIVTAILGLLVVGIWALWWEDVRGLVHKGGEAPSAAPPAAANGQT